MSTESSATKKVEQYSNHHVYPLWWLWSDNVSNRIRLIQHSHNQLHKILDISNLDEKLEDLYKAHNHEYVRSSTTIDVQYTLLADFFHNYDHLPKNLQPLLAQKIRQVILWHLRDWEHLTGKTYYKHNKYSIKIIKKNQKTPFSHKDIQDLLLIDKMVVSDMVIHIRRQLQKLLTKNPHIENTDVFLTPNSKTTTNTHMVPLSLHGRHIPSNQLESISKPEHEHLMHLISDTINTGRRRRTARKATNDKLLFWSQERDRRYDLQNAYFAQAETVLKNEWHDNVREEYNLKMNQQMTEDWQKWELLSQEKVDLTHTTFSEAHRKSIDFAGKIWDELKSILLKKHYFIG